MGGGGPTGRVLWLLLQASSFGVPLEKSLRKGCYRICSGVVQPDSAASPYLVLIEAGTPEPVNDSMELPSNIASPLKKELAGERNSRITGQ